jgi:hypothetical protein
MAGNSIVKSFLEAYFQKRDLTKAELLQLNHTQFPSMGIFVSKKVGNRKN